MQQAMQQAALVQSSTYCSIRSISMKLEGISKTLLEGISAAAAAASTAAVVYKQFGVKTFNVPACVDTHWPWPAAQPLPR
jgi:hypothetical protein